MTRRLTDTWVSTVKVSEKVLVYLGSLTERSMKGRGVRIGCMDGVLKK